MKKGLNIFSFLPLWAKVLLIAIACVIFFRLFVKLKQSARNLLEVKENSSFDKEIAKEAGVSQTRVSEMRSVAHDVAYELETLKGMGAWETFIHIQLDAYTYPIFARVKTIDEMRLVKTFYKNDYTDHRDLYQDLSEHLSNVNTIPNIEGLQ